MALIKCPECNCEVSDKADVCIHCGYPLKENEKKKYNSNEIANDVSDITIQKDEVIETNETVKSLDEDVDNKKNDLVCNTPVKKNKKKLLCSSIILAVIAIIIITTVFCYHHSDSYYVENIDSLIDKENYTEASEWIEKLHNQETQTIYENKIATIKKNNQIKNAKTNSYNCLVNGDLEGALSSLKSIEDITDITEELDEIEDYALAYAFASVVKDSLKNPSSLQINKFLINNSNNYMLLDYSGQNGFGGTSRSSVILTGTNIYEEDDYGYSDKEKYYFSDKNDYTSLDINIIMACINSN